MLVLLVVIACWRLAESGRPYLAGAILGLSVLKPQLIIAVPFVLLLSGRWRVTAGWAVTSGALAIASLLVIGTPGVSDYRSLLAEAQTVVNNRFFPWAYLVRPGPASDPIPAVRIAPTLLAPPLHP